MATYIFVCLALLATATAVPTHIREHDSYSCATTCSTEAGKFQYQQGTTYTYDYKVDTETSIAGASEDSGKLSIQAHVQIDKISGCEYIMNLGNVRISHSTPHSDDLQVSDREDEFRRPLERNSLRFSFDDGTISNVCPPDDEDIWVLNFKRGVLSAFQNGMKIEDGNQKVPEIDVTGNCEAEYTVSKNWGWRLVTIKKSKDLLACSQRGDYKTILQTVPYKAQSGVQSLPIVKSTQMCEYVIDSSKALQSATCEETHVYVPFSNHQSGGKTKVQQKLTLTSKTRPRNPYVAGLVTQRLSLLYQYSNGLNDIEMSREAAEQKLKEICTLTREDIRPETPRLFSELIGIIKGMDQSELQRLYRLIKDKVICPRNDQTITFYLDALPMAGTTGPVQTMLSLIKSRKVKGMLVQTWLSSLTLIQDPSEGMIQEAANLLEGSLFEDAALPVTAMVNNFCKKDSNCADNYYVKQVIQKLDNAIDDYCTVDDNSLDIVLRTLRAIGNLGHGSTLVSKLNTCMTSRSSPLEVRVAAADAFRNFECPTSFTRESELLSTLKDTRLDVELRVTAYLSLMRCPDTNTLDQVADILSQEENEQVGSFMYSHLTNLMETSDPHKQDIANAIRKLSLREFNLMKFSRNYESSFLINKLNLGLTADANVIMSSTSPLPRAAKANLTLDLFGNSVNVLEFGGRVEGLEELVDMFMKRLGNLYEGSEKKNKEKFNDVTASVFARVFGNEVMFKHIKGINLSRKQMPNYLDFLMNLAEKQEMAFTRSQQIMDTSFILPTIAGLPLSIAVNGSANVDVHAKGKADLLKISSSPRSLDIDGEISFSAALEITGTMGVDAFITQMGVRMRNTMHSSTGVKATIELKRGRELSVEIDPPKDKMEVFQARSQFYIIHNNIEKEQKMIEDNRKEYKVCTGETMAHVLGTELCMELQFPNASMHEDSPYFPLTGPSSFSVQFNKRDTHNSYKLFFKATESKKNSIAQFMMNTPGSKVNRLISTDLTIGYLPDKYIDVILISPWQKIHFNSAVAYSKNLLSLTGTLLLDEQDKYAVTTEVKMDKKKNAWVYTPFVQLSTPEFTKALVSGKVEHSGYKKLDVDLELKDMEDGIYYVKSNLLNQDREKRIRGSFNNGGRGEYLVNIGTTIDGSSFDRIRLKPELVVKTPSDTLLSVVSTVGNKKDKSFNGVITVNMYRMKPVSLSVVNKALKGSRIDSSLRLKSTLISGSLKSTTTWDKDSRSSLKINGFYSIPKIGKKSFILSNKLTDRSKNTFKKYLLKSNLIVKKNPEYNTGLVLDLQHKANQHSEAILEVTYGPDPNDKTKKITASTSISKNDITMKNGNLNMAIKAFAPAQNIDIDVRAKHAHTTSNVDTSMSLKLVPLLENDITTEINIKNKGKGKRLYNIIGDGKLGLMGKEYIVNTVLNQKSPKQYSHILNVTDYEGKNHIISTVYRIPGKNKHELISDIDFANIKPLQMSVNALLDPNLNQISGSFIYDKDIYRISADSKIAKNKAGKWDMEIEYPTRKVQLSASGKNAANKVDGSVSVNWDAKKRNSKNNKIALDGFLRFSDSEDTTSLFSGKLNLQSPFKNMEDIKTYIKYSGDQAKRGASAKISWGGKKDTVSTNVVINNPLTLSNVHINFEAETPFRQYREVALDIDHKLDEDLLMTMIKATMENEKAELSITGNNKENYYGRELKGMVDLKTPFTYVRNLSLSLSHKDEDNKYTTMGSVIHNNNKYNAEMEIVHDFSDSNLVNNGNLKLTWPRDYLETTWKHKSTGIQQIKTVIGTTMSNNRRFLIDLTGSNEGSANSRHIEGNLLIQTPWKRNREFSIKVGHQHDLNKLHSTAAVYNNRREECIFEFLVQELYLGGNAKFHLKSPLTTSEIKSEGSVSYRHYPATATMYLQWAPRSRVEFDGSLVASAWDAMEMDAKMTTPFEHMENINVRGSCKRDRGEIVTHANIAYDIRKMIDFENRIRFDQDVSLLRVKLTTPCPFMKSLDTGFHAGIKQTGFDGTADFELVPQVDKYDGSVSYDYQDHEFNGKLRLNTPLEKMSHLQLASWSRKKSPSGRMSHIEVETSLTGAYSVDASYQFDKPYKVDVIFKSPHADYNNIGLTAELTPYNKRFQSTAKLTYLTNKDIDADFNLVWSRKLAGNLEIKTPFVDYRKNRILFSHDGELLDFVTHGEAHIGLTDVTGDVTFSSKGQSTTGSFKLVSPIPELETIEANFNKQGKLMNLKVSTSLILGKDNYRAEFLNKYMSDFSSDLSIYTPYTKDLHISINQNVPNDLFNWENKVKIQYGNKDLSSKLMIFVGDEKQKAKLILQTPWKALKSLAVNFENEGTLHNMQGKGTITSSIKHIRDIEISYSYKGSMDDMKASANILKNSESLVNTLIEMHMSEAELHGQIVTQGKWLPELTAKMDHKGLLSNFNTNARLNGGDGNVFDSEISFKIEESKLDVNGRTSYKLNGDDHTYIIKIQKEGGLDDFHVQVTEGIDEQGLTCTVQFQAKENIKGLILLSDNAEPDSKMGLTFEHSGDLNKFITTSKIYMSKNKVISGKADFYTYKMERVEATVEVTSPFEGYEYNKIEYRHEGLNTVRSSCNLNVLYGNDKKISADLILQQSPSHMINFNVKTPFNEYKNILLAGNFDDSKVEAEVILTPQLQFTLTGVRDSSVYPYHPMYKVTTPFKEMKTAILNMKGEPQDGTIDVTVDTYDMRIDANAALKYDGPFAMSASTSLAGIKDIEPISISLTNSEDAYSGKKIQFLAEYNNGQQIALDGLYFSKDSNWNSKKERKLEVDFSFPPLARLTKVFFTVEHNAETGKSSSTFAYGLNDEKILDMDVNYETLETNEINAVFRKPWPMEYSANCVHEEYLKSKEVYLNWDKDDAESNLRVKTLLKDTSYGSTNDKVVSWSLVRALRTMGVEHTLRSTPDKLASQGKLYWNSDDESQLTYEMDLSGMNGRRDTVLDGSFKLGMPSRTIGVTGSVSDDVTTKKADATFSWDIDRDSSKQVSIRASLTESEYTKADVSLILPAEVQVDSEVILNQGDTIFDSKTDISYSRDSRKTLTLYSKVKNNPVSTYSYFYGSSDNNFNYSIEVGVSHPETKLDMALDSHVAQVDDLITSSLGVNYLTSRRQMKNMALSAEIDRVKKQLSLVAFGPYKTVSLKGRVDNEQPFALTLDGTVDGDELFKSSLDLDTDKKILKMTASKFEDVLSLKAYYPNDSAIQVELNHNQVGFDQVEASLTLSLINPRLLYTYLYWRPAMIDEAQNFIAEKIAEMSDETRDALLQISRDMEVELEAKYKEITKAISEDAKPMLNFMEEEFASLGDDIKRIKRGLRYMVRNNEFYLKDFIEDLDIINEKYTLLLETLQEISDEYTESYTTTMQAMSSKLEEIQKYHVGDILNAKLYELSTIVMEQIDDLVVSIIEYMEESDKNMLNLVERSQGAYDGMRDLLSQYKVEHLMSHIGELTNTDYYSYTEPLLKMSGEQLNKLSGMGLKAYALTRSNLYKVLPENVRNTADMAINEAHQQVKWAYNYWGMEENFKRNTQILVEILKEIIAEELNEWIHHLQAMTTNPIRIYDPKNGKIQVDIPLPIALKNLKDLPNIETSFNKYKLALWGNKTAVQPVVLSDLDTYEPIRPFKFKQRKFKHHQAFKLE